MYIHIDVLSLLVFKIILFIYLNKLSVRFKDRLIGGVQSIRLLVRVHLELELNSLWNSPPKLTQKRIEHETFKETYILRSQANTTKSVQVIFKIII
jgi:hypothetical protein